MLGCVVDLGLIMFFQKVDLRSHYRNRTQGGVTLTYVSWADLAHSVGVAGIDYDWEIELVTEGSFPYLKGTLTVRTDRGSFVRQAIAPINPANNAYANPLEEAESAAFRRSWAKFGVGLELWQRKSEGKNAR